MLNKKFKKVFSAVTMFATVVCLSGVSMLAPLSANAATTFVDGDLVKSNAVNSDGTPAVSSLDIYIVKTVGTKTFKRLVLNPDIFKSYGHLKWENVKTVSQAEIDAIKTSSLVRVDGDAAQKVYAVTPVTGGDTGAKSWVNVSAADFLTAGSDVDSIYTINSTDSAAYSGKVDITSVTQLKAFYKDGTLPAGTLSGDLTVALAATTPESMNIPNGSLVDFTDVKLTASSSDASINSITVSANGLGADSAFTGVALYVDGAKVGTSKTSINSSRQAIFNFSTPIAISAGASKTLTIKGSVNASSSYVLGIKAASDIVTTGGTVGGTFPIWGNALSSVQNDSIGTVILGSVNGTDVTGVNFGTDNELLAAFNLTANNEAALFSSIRLKNGGTNADGIISNLKLVIDGESIADGTYDASTGYVTFNIDGNYKIKKSGSVSVEVYGDMGTASVGDTVTLYLKSKDDVVFTGETYGFGVQLTTPGFQALDTVAEGLTITMATGDISIDMDKAATPDKDVKAGDTGVVLATFSVTSNGEDATINQITGTPNFQIRGASLATGKITNAVMVDKDNGSTYDLNAAWVSDAAWDLSMNDEISLAKGVKKTFEIKADLDDSIASNATLKVYVASAAMSITGDVSDAAITNITPANVLSATATVKPASLDWTTSALSNKSVVPGAADVVVYQASLEAGSASDIKLSTVTLTNETGAANTFTDNNISKLDLYLNGKLIKSVSNSIAESATTASITFNSLTTTGDVNVIKAGTTATLEAKATFASSLTTGTFNLGINDGASSIISRDATDNSTIVETVSSGSVGTGSRRITTAGQGTLKVELLTSDSKTDSNSYVLAGASTPGDKYLAELKFTTANEAMKLTDLKLVNSGTATNGDIAEVDLVNASGTIVASKIPTANGSVVYSNLSLTLPADQATSYFVSVKTKGMNVDGDAASTATQGHTIIYNINPLAGVIAKGVDSSLDSGIVLDPDGGTVATSQWSAAAILSKTEVISGSVITAIVNNLSDGNLTPGVENVIAKYTLTFENGSNRTTTNDQLKAILKNLTLTYTGTNLDAFTNVNAYIDGTTAKAAGTPGSGTLTWTNLNTLSDNGKVDGAVTLVITATPNIHAAGNATLQVSLDDDTGIQFIGAGEGSTVNPNNYLFLGGVKSASLKYSA
jgi:hypothetical protein